MTHKLTQLVVIATMLLLAACGGSVPADPTEPPIDQPPADTPAEPPADTPADTPVEPPADAPAEPPADAPAEPPADELPGPPAGEVAHVQSQVVREQAPAATPEQIAAVAAGNNAFAVDLYRQVIATQDGNLVFSPWSIESALAMVYGGARNQTEAQIAAALRFTLPQDELHPAFNALSLDLDAANTEGFQFNVGNAIWGQPGYPFEQPYLDLLALNYGAGLNLTDFTQDPEAARQIINQWVEQQTEGNIPDLMPPGSIDDLTRLVLTNAIYLKAKWLLPFDPGLTAESPFTLLDGSSVNVPTMSNRSNYQSAAGDGWQAINLPYQGERMAMAVIVPDDFATFETGLNDIRLDEILTNVQNGEVADIQLNLPKFDFASDISLKDSLIALGMADAFTPGQADFSGIDGTLDLYVQAAIHKATITVDEEGTEASAATGISIGVTSMPQMFNVDRPFLFVLYDQDTGAVLFIGRVLNPLDG